MEKSINKILSETYKKKGEILKIFKEEKKRIEECTGLNLSNIEILGLWHITKNIIEKLSNELADNVNPFTRISESEIGLTFFERFYEVDIWEIQFFFPINTDEDWGKLKNFFRKKQSENHFP